MPRVIVPKESPLLLRPHLATRVLEDQKHQTRRLVNPQPPEGGDIVRIDGSQTIWRARFDESFHRMTEGYYRSPYGYAGDLLYVRESHWQYGTWVRRWDEAAGKFRQSLVRWFKDTDSHRALGIAFTTTKPLVQFSMTPPEDDGPDWFRRPSIFLPKWGSRIWLRVNALRIERLQDITEEDIEAEGITFAVAAWMLGTNAWTGPLDIRRAFSISWDKINGKRGQPWDANPFVWVVDFERTEKPA